jgi:hypothetical protein
VRYVKPPDELYMCKDIFIYMYCETNELREPHMNKGY